MSLNPVESSSNSCSSSGGSNRVQATVNGVGIGVASCSSSITRFLTSSSSPPIHQASSSVPNDAMSPSTAAAQARFLPIRHATPYHHHARSHHHHHYHPHHPHVCCSNRTRIGGNTASFCHLHHCIHQREISASSSNVLSSSSSSSPSSSSSSASTSAPVYLCYSSPSRAAHYHNSHFSSLSSRERHATNRPPPPPQPSPVSGSSRHSNSSPASSSSTSSLTVRLVTPPPSLLCRPTPATATTPSLLLSSSSSSSIIPMGGPRQIGSVDNNQSLPSSSSPSSVLPAAQSSIFAAALGNLPTTSAVSSSSSSPTPSLSASADSAAANAPSSRDWFTYDFKIDNIQELIRMHETQQSFIQSPIFSFSNHLVSVQTAAAAGSSTTPPSTPTNCMSPVFNSNSSEASSSSSSSSCALGATSSVSTSSSGGGGGSTSGVVSSKEPSSWRLIFYPNGAGPDCKNFLSIFLKYLSDEPVKIQMMFSIVDNQHEDVYVKYTVNMFNKANDWGFKQLIHKNAIIYQREKFLKSLSSSSGGGSGSLLVRVKMRLDEHKHDYIKKLNENLHYCKLLSENFSQYYYNLSGAASGGCGNEPRAECNELATLAASTAPDSTPAAASSCSQASSSSSSHSSSASTSSSPASSKPVENKHASFASLTGMSSLNNSYYDIVLLVKSSGESSSSSSSSGNDQRGQKRSSDSTVAQPCGKRIKQCSSETNQASVAAAATSMTARSNENEEYIELRAHKCILAARSPVFKAMFNYKLKENLTNRVIIEDFRADVVKAMLKYIYTAYLPDDIKSIAIDLYIAAEKYFIESLKIKCREYLVENLCLDSAVHTYILAEMYNDSMLRKQSLKFINEHVNQVTQSSEWNELVTIYPQVFSKAFARVCKKDF